MTTDIWNGNGNWISDPTDWSAKAAPTSGDIAEIQSGQDTLTGAGTVSSVVIAPGALLFLGEAASLTASKGMFSLGTVEVDQNGAAGGAKVSLGGVLTNSGSLFIGNNALSAATTVTAAGFTNSGSLTLQGSALSAATELATLDITAASPTALTGTTFVGGDADLEFKTSAITSIAAGAYVELDGGQARISVGAGTASTALKGLAANYGTLRLRGDSGNGAGGEVLTTTVGFDNAATLYDDNDGDDGGSKFTIGGTLTNTGVMLIGNASLSQSDTLTAAGLANSGSISLQGNAGSGTTDQATLDITAASPTALTGTTFVGGDADLEFKTSAITSIAAGAYVELDGGQARISVGAGTASTALKGLAANYGTLRLRGDSGNGAGGAAVTTTTGFDNAATLYDDNDGADGGSKFTIGGTLTNTGVMLIGNTALSQSDTLTAAGLANSGSISLQGNAGSGTTDQATLDITAASPTALTGTTFVGGDADLEFKTSAITSIAAGAYVELDGGQARISVGAGTASTALKGLAANYGTLRLRGDSGNGAGGEVLTTTVGFDNAATLYDDNDGDDGGSKFTIGGTLTNTGVMLIGNASLSQSDTLTAAGLANSGSISLQGNAGSGTTNQVTLNITVASPTALTGSTFVGGDAELEFASGAITSIAAGAYVELDGAQARISIGGGAANTALKTLAANHGTLRLRGDSGNGAGGQVLTTTVGFDNANTLYVDSDGDDGGSKFTIGGTLTNTGVITIGNSALSQSDTVTAVALINNGTINLSGNSTLGTTNQATLAITGASTLTGAYYLHGDADLEFTHGLTSIGAGAYLQLDGAQARISVGAGSGNSGLGGLGGNAGTFDMEGDWSSGPGGSSVSTSGGFDNSGALSLDVFGGDGDSSLAIGGTLTNTGSIAVGNYSLSAATLVSAKGLANTGAITVTGSGNFTAELAVAGNAHTSGDVTIQSGGEVDVGSGFAYIQTSGLTAVTGALVAPTIDANGGRIDFIGALTKGDGVGTLNVGAAGALEFGAAVDASHTVNFTAASGTLELGDAGAFAGKIAGFGGNDVIDLLGQSVTGLSFASGVLTVSGSSGVIARLSFSGGGYTTGSFTTVADGAGGTDILDPPTSSHSAAIAAAARFTQSMAAVHADAGPARESVLRTLLGAGEGHLLTAPAHA